MENEGIERKCTTLYTKEKGNHYKLTKLNMPLSFESRCNNDSTRKGFTTMTSTHRLDPPLEISYRGWPTASAAATDISGHIPSEAIPPWEDVTGQDCCDMEISGSTLLPAAACWLTHRVVRLECLASAGRDRPFGLNSNNIRRGTGETRRMR
jgi:hypothetical protein